MTTAQTKPPDSSRVYSFQEAFAPGKYNKFASRFPLANPGRNTASSGPAFDCKLVNLLAEKFGMKEDANSTTKDIMICCLRNDRELAKIAGAVDTLLLVEKLKSVN